MKVFLIKIICFLAAITAFSLCFEVFLSKELKQGKRYYRNADWFDLNNHNSDIIFAGNSRTCVHIDPFAIQNKLNAKCEIIGMDGQAIDVVWLKFKQYIKVNKPPRELYLQFDPWFLTSRDNFFGWENFCTGFYMDRIDLTQLRPHEGYSEFYRFLPMAAINAELFWKIVTSDTVTGNDTYEASHGFEGVDKNWKGDWKNIPPISFLPNSISANYIDSFVVCCKQNNIKLYGIFSPQSANSYKQLLNLQALDSLTNAYEKKYDWPFAYIDFNTDSLYNDSTLFYNHQHLNKKGVDVFMKQLLASDKCFKSFE